MRQFRGMKQVHLIAEKIIPFLPDWITGNTGIMRQKYRIRYGDVDYEKYIRDKKLRIMTTYLIICFVFILIGLSSLAEQRIESKRIEHIKRPEYGKMVESFPVRVQVMYQDYALTKDVTIKAAARELTGKEKQKLVRSFKNKLPEIILGENKDLEHVNKPLNLIDRDVNSGITIKWVSRNPEVINEKGDVYLLKAKDNQKVELITELTLDDITITENYQIKIDTDASEEDYKKNLNGALEEELEQMTESSSSKNIKLPAELGNGVEVLWFSGKNNGTFLIVAFFFAILIAFFKRYDQINKEIKEAEESITKDLPEFINKLVLLLNAGLVVSSAFSKIVEDYELVHSLEIKARKKKRFLYDGLYEIQKKVNQSNASLIKELKEFSQRSGVREFVRITAVIADNWNKGSMLAEKLEAESEMLWVTRKKRAEEKGKIAETKLTLPLMILLIVLIMITIAPAMMEM